MTLQDKLISGRKYTAKVGQDNVNIGVVTIFRLANRFKPEEGWCWPAEIL